MVKGERDKGKLLGEKKGLEKKNLEERGARSLRGGGRGAETQGEADQ